MTTLGTTSSGESSTSAPHTGSFAVQTAGDLYGRESGAASPPSTTHYEVSTSAHHGEAPHQVHAITVRHDADAFRYDALADGEIVGHLTYAVEGMYLNLTHTEVDVAWGGRGIAGQLVQAAVEDVKSGTFHGVARVKPTCPYVAGWLDRHPEFAALRA